MTRRALALGATAIAALTLAACGSSASDPGLGGLSEDEAATLNQAAVMLDANSVVIDNNIGPDDEETQ